MDVSVVIPTWNGAARIPSALRSLAEQTLDPERFEIVVVDDGGTDGLGQVVDRFADLHPEITIRYVHIEHAGVNAARNAGITNSSGRLVMLLDDDEDAPVDFLARVVAIMEDRPDVPGVGGPCELKGSGFRTCATCRIGDASLPVAGAGTTERLLGGNMVVRREVFDEVGLFDVAISGRGDETEWFHRADRQFWYDESLFLWHRRDHMTLRELLATGFHQGRSVPIAARRMGGPEWRPSAMRMGRYLGHGISKRCVNGLLQEARSLGALSTWVGMRLPGRRSARGGHLGDEGRR